MRSALALALLPLAAFAQGTLTLQLVDYAAVPQSGELVNSPDNAVYVARVNFLREEPGPELNRFFVCDLNGKLYLLDKATRQFTSYLDFHRNTTENASATGLFGAFTRANGYANGLVTFQFDPEYRTTGSPNFGKFYTVHIEIDTNDGDARRVPNASSFPGYSNAADYAPTTALEAPGTDNASTRHAVLIEWQDTNPANTTFEGTAREVLRIEFNGRIHPLGDLLFNPLATTPAHPDYRKLYLAVGDGGAGEQNNATLHPTPQRTDVVQGKILRISPDDPDGAGPQRYGIPNDNPFTGPAVTVPAGTRPEIWAYGFRNPHRLAWDAPTNTLITSDIGFHSWEEVNLVRRGGNYGWAEREGTFAFDVGSGLTTGQSPITVAGDPPRPDHLNPVIQYPHSPALGYGDAIAGGFVYRGTRLPELRGKFVFGDITTGELFYADFSEMLAAAERNVATPAAFHSLKLEWDNPRTPIAVLERYDRMYEIVAGEYRARGGRAATLPGSATVSDLTGGGRADIRLAVDHAGELYILSKSDGMIRAVVGVARPVSAPVITRQPQAQAVVAGGTAVLAVEASNGAAYQWMRNGETIAGATGSLFVLRAVAGNYSVDVTNAAGPTASATVPLVIANTADPGRIANFSIRSTAGAGAQTLIVGFNGRGPLLARAVGPGLGSFGVSGALADPLLQVRLFPGLGGVGGSGPPIVAENDNWETAGAEVSAVAARVLAFPLAPGSRDAAVVLGSLSLNSYTLQVGSAGGSAATGIALAELFDAAPSGSGATGLLNVSARTQVAPGENTLIAGFVIGGATARTVLIRAAGPILGTFGVAGPLADPRLTVLAGSTPIAENDNWQTSPELVNVFREAAGAFPFVARSRDAVLLLTLPPGGYTAQVSGVGANASGVALVEVYALP